MWQRFTERARRVVWFAQDEAQHYGGKVVSTEHLLLALVREDGTMVERVLERLNVSLEQVRSAVSAPEGESYAGQDIQLSPRAKRVIDLAFDEARQLNNNYIGTEHLLLGLIREEHGLASRVLAGLSVSLDRTRDAVIHIQDNASSVGARAEGALAELRKLPEDRQAVLQEYGIRFENLPPEAQSAVEAYLNTGFYGERMVVDVSSAVIRMTTETIGATKQYRIVATGATVAGVVTDPG